MVWLDANDNYLCEVAYRGADALPVPPFFEKGAPITATWLKAKRNLIVISYCATFNSSGSYFPLIFFYKSSPRFRFSKEVEER